VGDVIQFPRAGVYSLAALVPPALKGIPRDIVEPEESWRRLVERRELYARYRDELAELLEQTDAELAILDASIDAATKRRYAEQRPRACLRVADPPPLSLAELRRGSRGDRAVARPAAVTPGCRV
jgi:hypothetical protein